MVKYFCGCSDLCNKHTHDNGLVWEKVKKSTEIAKLNVAKNFYVIGILGTFFNNYIIRLYNNNH